MPFTFATLVLEPSRVLNAGHLLHCLPTPTPAYISVLLLLPSCQIYNFLERGIWLFSQLSLRGFRDALCSTTTGHKMIFWQLQIICGHLLSVRGLPLLRDGEALLLLAWLKFLSLISSEGLPFLPSPVLGLGRSVECSCHQIVATY